MLLLFKKILLSFLIFRCRPNIIHFSSFHRWWNEYASRKNDEEDEHEHVANSLLYDRNHLPRMAPAPDCVNDPTPPSQ
jgi:hypothetical protein